MQTQRFETDAETKDGLAGLLKTGKAMTAYELSDFCK